jgi:RNA polymerase sigma-70 factor (ECF subfamily)
LRETTDLDRLLAQIAKRDRPAFQDLYSRTAPKLLGVILRIIRDRARAEDVLQEVYLRVWERAGSFDPAAGRPMTWLITIARNRAIDVARQRLEVLVADDEDTETDWVASIADPRDESAEFETVDQLRHCLDRLEELQRRCILEAYYEGYSREELARRHSRPVNTIKTWLHRGATTLRSCLEEA